MIRPSSRMHPFTRGLAVTPVSYYRSNRKPIRQKEHTMLDKVYIDTVRGVLYVRSKLDFSQCWACERASQMENQREKSENGDFVRWIKPIYIYMYIWMYQSYMPVETYSGFPEIVSIFPPFPVSFFPFFSSLLLKDATFTGNRRSFHMKVLLYSFIHRHISNNTIFIL